MRKLSIGSRREMGREGLADVISREGTPSLLACDVNPAPDMLIKLASYFNARLSVPDRDMGDREKSGLVKGMHFSNEHERDAAAAAMRAFRFYENKLRQIDRILKERNLTDKADEVKHLVLNNTSLSNALLMIDIEREIEMPKVKSREEAVINLDKKNKQLKELLVSNAELRKALDILEDENAALREKLKLLERGVFERLARDREFRKKEIEIMRLKDKKSRKKEVREESKSEEGELDIEGIVEEYRGKHKHL